MRKNKFDKSVYKLKRMVPPGQLKFYFTVGNRKMISTNLDIHESDESDSITVPKTNIIRNIARNDQMITETFVAKLGAKPRPKRRLPRPRPKSPWSLSKSVFRTYKDDTEALMKKCFEYDWE